MELTQKQKEGLDIAIQRYLDDQKFTIISGYIKSFVSFVEKTSLVKLN